MATSTVERRVCSRCKKSKSIKAYFKIANPLLPDSRISVCSDCIHETIDEQNINEVIEFLRLTNKPYIKEEWDKSLAKAGRTIGEYMRIINSLNAYKDFTFANSDNLGNNGNDSSIINASVKELETESGKRIYYSSDLISKWGGGFKEFEYLKMEKYYQDMMDTNEIITPVQKDMLQNLAKMIIKRDGYIAEDNITEYSKVSRTYDDMLKSAGFRPIDRRGVDDERGLRSFSQIFEEVEKRGFIKPLSPEEADRKLELGAQYYKEDMIDTMLKSILNYYHRLIGKEILSATPEDMMGELSEFFEGQVDEFLEEELIRNGTIKDEIETEESKEIKK